MTAVVKSNSTVILGTSYKDSNRSEIRIHVSSLFRFTYRKDFPTLHPYPISSDAGWGCMLRSAQMLMACALQRHLLGRGWRKSDDINVLRSSNHYCDILRWFSDYPGPPHVYSIHHLVQCGMKYDRLPGEWFGPSTAALVLRDLTKLHRSKYGGPLEVLVTQGDTIYIKDCEKLCTSGPHIEKKDATNSTVEISKSTNGNHVTNSAQDFLECDRRKSVESIEETNLNSISEEDTMFSTCMDTIKPTAAADFVNATSTSSSSSSSSCTKKSPSKGKASGMKGSKEASTASTTTTTTINSETASKVPQGPQPIFDPLLNPPPSYTAPWDCSLVVCIPLRLGITAVSSEYIEVRIEAFHWSILSLLFILC
jgi:Peptidase family C54